MQVPKGYIYVNQYTGIIPIEREFYCRHCGQIVKITDEKDKRTVYCCKKCEKQYWREISKRNSIYSKRGREVTGLRNYSGKEMAIKLWREKKEAEENYWGGKNGNKS